MPVLKEVLTCSCHVSSVGLNSFSRKSGIELKRPSRKGGEREMQEMEEMEEQRVSPLSFLKV